MKYTKMIFPVILIAGGMLMDLFFANKPVVQFTQKAEAQMEKKVSTDSIKIKQFDDVMDQYFRKDPVTEASSAVNAMIDKYNQWMEESEKEIKNQQAELEDQIAIIRKIESQISESDRKLKHIKSDTGNKKSVAEYNSLVKAHNELVEKHKSLSDSCKSFETNLNELIKLFNEESDQQKANIEQTKKTAEKIVTNYHAWINTDGDLAFFNELNVHYALLYAEKRRVGNKFEKLSELQKIQSLRMELGEYTRKKHEKTENGLIVVKATLCGGEDAYFIVDTGATLVTVSPEIVEALGLTDKLGDEMELTLAGGIKTKGRRFIIPEITVFGKTAKNVESVALAPSEAGIDGLLGQSFLNYFNYKIDKTHDPKLILKNKDSSKL